ncbi:MAG: hypothetical protein JF606_27950, partial [Burkholderiales bacterium]|nr:hypothetical protein [Burkholderiales bacterium]
MAEDVKSGKIGPAELHKWSGQQFRLDALEGAVHRFIRDQKAAILATLAAVRTSAQSELLKQLEDEPLEAMLHAKTALKIQLNLPDSVSSSMAYQSISVLTNGDLHAFKSQVLEQEADPEVMSAFLLGNDTWRTGMKTIYAQEFADLRERQVDDPFYKLDVPRDDDVVKQFEYNDQARLFLARREEEEAALLMRLAQRGSHPGTPSSGASSSAWIGEPATQHEVHDLGNVVGNGWQHGNQSASRLMIRHLVHRGLVPRAYGEETSFLIHGKRYTAALSRTDGLWLTQVQSPREPARALLPEQPFPFGLLASDLNAFFQQYNAEMGLASGQGLNCLLDSMLQFRIGVRRGRNETQQTHGLDWQVGAMRLSLEQSGLVPANDMIDFYSPGAVGATIAATLGLRVQIIQQQEDGQLTAHDAFGAGQFVRILHTPGHFQPLWPNH